MADLNTRPPPPYRREQFAISFLAFSLLFAFSILFALAQPDPTFFRTHALAWSSALLVTPALYIFVRRYGRAPLTHWWRLFWTFAWAMIAVHLIWGLGLEHDWRPLTVFERQGFFVAFPIFLLQGLWLIDIAMSWTRIDWAWSTGVYKYWQGFMAVFVFANFFVAMVIFRNDTESLVIGLLQTAVVIGAFLLRWNEREQSL